MTRFWRNGFFRTGMYGDTHWVEGHWVERDNWESGSHHTYYYQRLSEMKVGGSIASCVVIPNAECPVCKADVFFYQNKFGSKVYFDDLGPPWPKHPCMDQNLQTANHNLSSGEVVSPAIRSHSQVHAIECFLENVYGYGEQKEYIFNKSSRKWSVKYIEKRLRENGCTFLIMSSPDSDRRTFVCASSLPRCLEKGCLVFYRAGVVNFFDVLYMNEKEVIVEKLSGASEFVDRFVTGGS